MENEPSNRVLDYSSKSSESQRKDKASLMTNAHARMIGSAILGAAGLIAYSIPSTRDFELGSLVMTVAFIVFVIDLVRSYIG